MYTIIDNGTDAVVITANNRDTLNRLTNKAEDAIWDKYGDCTYNESRSYGDAKPNVDKFNVVKVKDFKPKY